MRDHAVRYVHVESVGLVAGPRLRCETQMPRPIVRRAATGCLRGSRPYLDRAKCADRCNGHRLSHHGTDSFFLAAVTTANSNLSAEPAEKER